MNLNIHATRNKLQRKNKLGSIPHQKFILYHFPTRGRAGVKLGDAWYVSNVSIIFDGFMLLSCQTLDVLYAFYIFFGTNLLTQCQVLVSVFPCFWPVFRRSPNGMKLYDDFFGTKRDPRSFGRSPDGPRWSHKPSCRHHSPRWWRAGLWPPRGPNQCNSTVINFYKFRNPQKET